MNNKQQEMVNHPSHYNWLRQQCGIEPIEICQHFGFNIGNALKYLMRKGKTEGNMNATAQRIQDLLKAQFYINYEIDILRRQEAENFAQNKQPSSSSVKEIVTP